MDLSKLWEKLKSLPTWARIVVLLAAALAAFALSSCSSAVKISRSGVHVDTVRVDYQARSKNYSSFNM